MTEKKYEIPKTYTVSYFNENEWNKDLNPEEIKQQQDIADYYNQFLSQDKSCGPVWGGEGKPYVSSSKSVYIGVGGYGAWRRSPSPERYDRCKYCLDSKKEWDLCQKSSCKQKADEEMLNNMKWVGKTALTLGTSWFLGPETSIKVGGLAWGTTKVIEGLVEDEGVKEVLNFIGDIGWDTAKGGFVAKLIGVSSSSLASKTTQEIGHFVAKEIASNGGKIAGDIKELIEIGRMISLCQNVYDLKDKYEKYGGKVFCELARHKYHKEQGKDYDSNCEVCKS